MTHLDPFGSAQASAFKAVYRAPLRVNPEPSARDQVEGNPAFYVDSRRVDLPIQRAHDV
jgi:hypothetical protein